MLRPLTVITHLGSVGRGEGDCGRGMQAECETLTVGCGGGGCYRCLGGVRVEVTAPRLQRRGEPGERSVQGGKICNQAAFIKEGWLGDMHRSAVCMRACACVCVIPRKHPHRHPPPPEVGARTAQAQNAARRRGG